MDTNFNYLVDKCNTQGFGFLTLIPGQRRNCLGAQRRCPPMRWYRVF